MKVQKRSEGKTSLKSRPKEPERMPALHPGEVLLEEFMKPLAISQNQLGRDLGVPPRRINEIVHGKRSISADTAVRLAAYFSTAPQFWMGLQSDYDLEVMGDKIEEIRQAITAREDSPWFVAAL